MHQIIRLKGIFFIKEAGGMARDDVVEAKKASKRKKARKNPNSIRLKIKIKKNIKKKINIIKIII